MFYIFQIGVNREAVETSKTKPATDNARARFITLGELGEYYSFVLLFIYLIIHTDSVGRSGQDVRYRMFNCLFVRSITHKNLAIANRSRFSCINTNYTMTLKSGLEVTQGH